MVGGNEFDFRILTTHTVYKSELHWVREDELEAIEDWVASAPGDGEENLIAIGDFNANPPSQALSKHHFKDIFSADDSRYRVLWYESGAEGEDSVRTTVPTKDSSSNPTYFQLPQYDHVIVSSETSNALPSNSMTLGGNEFGIWEFDNDPWWTANGWKRSQIISAVSDHRPIWFKLEFMAEDQD